MAGYRQITCRVMEAFIEQGGMRALGGRSDLDGEYGPPKVETIWGWYDHEAIRSTRHPRYLGDQECGDRKPCEHYADLHLIRKTIGARQGDHLMAIELVGPAPSSWTTSLTSPLDATVQPISPARAIEELRHERDIQDDAVIMARLSAAPKVDPLLPFRRRGF